MPRLAQIMFVALVGVAVVAVAGCRTPGYKKGDAAARSSLSAAGEVQAQSRALDSTLAALGGMVSQPGEDLRPRFAHFSNSLDDLIKCADRVEKAGQRLEQRSVAYLAAWENELSTMTYEVIRSQSDARKMYVARQMSDLQQRYDETSEVVRPLIAYLEDIRKALRSDLTLGGVESIRTIAGKADDNVRKVQVALARLADELAQSSIQISSAAPKSPSPRFRNVGGANLPGSSQALQQD
jgi:hypothetical protein